MNNNSTCEVKQNGKWVPLPVTKAKASGERARCILPKCHGRVRLHRKSGLTPAHYEHFPKFAGCPNCYRYDGNERQNPKALK
jgi:uncharacterized protein with PIN domain